MDNSTTFCFKVWGDYALFTDPIMKIGGEKFTYPVPTYQALKGITESIYWKPTIQIYIDKVRVMNPILTEAKSILVPKFNDMSSEDLSRYTYLKDVEYQVQAHFEFNLNRPDLDKDRNTKKHYAIMKRCIEKGGRRDIFLGTRECQAYVGPCKFGVGVGYYDDEPEHLFGTMVHGIDYPDETGKKELGIRLWNVNMKKGIIDFPRPDDQSQITYRKLHDFSAKHFDFTNIKSVDKEYEEITGGDLE